MHEGTPDTAAATPFAWYPSEEFKRASNWHAFLTAEGLPDYAALARKASQEPEWFWDALLRFLKIRFYTPYQRVLDVSQGPAWPRWCAGATTNLVRSGLDEHARGPRAAHTAIVWEGEDARRRTWTYAELNAETCRMAAGLRTLGLGRGDVIGLYMPMLPETAAAFLAVAKIGGIVLPLFSGFGADAIATRLNEAGAKAVLTADGHWRRGKRTLLKPVLDEAAESVPSLRHVVVFRRLAEPVAMRTGRDVWWHDLVAGQPDDTPTEPMQAEDPVMIVYTSGTTGSPKGTVHTHIGFTAKTAQDFQLGFDLQAGDRMLWMTDIGWLVGPIQIVACSTVGATLVMAEGVPDYPAPGRLWDLVARHRVTFLGMSPTIARLMKRNGAAEVAKHDLSSLRVAASTGEPWDDDAWMWVFRNVLGGSRPLQNYSGGTEMGGIVATNILFPIKPASFFGPIPGTGADIVDESGRSLPPGVVGELVMREPCIGTTKGLWRDPQRYLESYWERIPGLWVHGDWASRDAEGAWYIHGRSDDTIKVAGKRTGPAEIEAALLATQAVSEAAAIAIPDAVKGAAVACVVVPSPDAVPGPAFDRLLADAIAAKLGTAFRPARIVAVSDLPKTRNMKVMRRVVRAAFTGAATGDLSALVNPESLDELRRALDEARTDGDAS